MSLHQYPLAGTLYFIALALIAWRVSARAKTHGQGAGTIAVIIIVAAVVFGLSVYWLVHTYQTESHQPNLVLRVAAWAWSHLGLLWELRWRWIIPSLVIGALLMTTINVIRSRRQVRELTTVACPDARIHQTKIHDREHVKDLVVICGIQYRPIEDGLQPSRIDFQFVLLNMSLFELSVDSIEGFIYLFETAEGKSYRFKLDPKLETDSSTFGFRQRAVFIVRQEFETDREAEYVLKKASPESLFQFKGFTVTLSVAGSDSITLSRDINFRMNEGWWLAHDEDFFVSSALAERSSTVTRLNVEIESLKSRQAQGLSETKAELGKQIGSKPDDVESLQRENAKLNEAIGGKRQQYKTLKQNYEEIERVLANKESEVSCLKSQLAGELTLELETESSAINSSGSHVVIFLREGETRRRHSCAKLKIRFNNTSKNGNRVDSVAVGIYKLVEGGAEQIVVRPDNFKSGQNDRLGGQDSLESMLIDPNKLTDYYWLFYYFDFTSHSDFQSAFIRVTMKALRQSDQVLDYDVDWEEALDRNYSSLTPRIRPSRLS